MKKVSVVVPIYNKAGYLDCCLNSLMNQTLKDLEVIVIDDCSTDNTDKVLEKYRVMTDFKIIRNEKNMGIGKTRNRGIELATGEYIGFVDADDYVNTDMYLKYYEFAKENKLDMVTGYYTKFGKCEKLFKNTYFEPTTIKSNIINEIDYGPCNKIFRLNIIKKHNIRFEENLKYEDMPFVAKNLVYSRVGHINESYYYYRIHDNSETTTIDSRIFDIFKIMDITNEVYKDVDYEKREYLNIHQITLYMLKSRSQRNSKLGIKFITDGYKYLDTNFKGWRNNKKYNKTNSIKRLITSNKLLLKMYCFGYKLFKLK